MTHRVMAGVHTECLSSSNFRIDGDLPGTVALYPRQEFSYQHATLRVTTTNVGTGSRCAAVFRLLVARHIACTQRSASAEYRCRCAASCGCESLCSQSDLNDVIHQLFILSV